MTVTLAAAALAPFDAEANTSNGSPTGYAWADNQGATGMVIARYATLPAAAGAGDGTINYPTVPEVYDYGNLAATVPVETITATAVNATTWDISGSVSGAHGQATTGVEYTTDHGVNFTITAGGIAFATGDTFIFDINDSVNASLVAGHLSYPILGTSTITIHSSTADFDWFNTDFFGSNNAGIGISSTGYLAVGDAFPAAGEDYREATSTNRQLPTVAAIADGSNDESIYPFWDALVGKSGSSINVASFGRAGQRMMVVQWSDFAHESDPTASFTFSVVLFENQDTVRFHYRTMSNGTGTAADGSSATIGGQGLVTDDFFGLNYGFEDPVVSNGLTIEIGDDNDGDGLPLRFEGSYGTSDNDSTSDDGLALDGAQLLAGLNPTVAGDNPTTDGDSDNLIDINETFLGLNPALADSDGDLVADDVEITAGTDPLKPDSDGDGLDDGVEDANQDGVVDPTETDPTDWDSDDDGTSDGFEVQVTTDPLDANVSRFTPVAEFSDPGSQITQEAALDSKGNLHVVSYSSASGSNQAPDNLYVGLYTDDGGSYDLSVDMTVLTSHIGYDDRQPTLVTVPQAGAMDKTLVFNGTKQGHAFLTELDFNQATLDGSSSDSATLVTNTYMIPLPLSVQHPKMAVGTDGNLHVVFLGTDSLNRDTSDSSGFSDQRVLRGVYHMKLSPTGTLMAGPTELYSKLPPNHGHTHPVVQVDSSGDVHTVFRAGACGWTGGPSGCDLYYAKLDGEGQALIPTQRLALMRNQAFEKAPSLAISPNGNVNLVYASVRPLPGNSNLGGYANGRILVLHVLSTVGNELTTLVDQKALMPLMIPSFADGNNDVSTYMIPAVACDAGGNLHIVSSEDNNAHLGTYMIFSPDGTKLAGPFTTTAGSGHDQQLPSVQIEGTRAFLSYATRNGPRATSFEFSGLSIDQSGAAQIPPPSADLTLTAATPDQGDAGQSVVLTLVGSGFRDGTTATVGGVAMSGLTRYDAAHLVGTLDTTGMAAGAHDVVVASPEETSATLVGGFYIGTRPSDEPDAGVDSEPDAGTDNKSDGGGCGCQQSGESTPLASLLLVGFLLVALRRRRTN